MPPARRKLPAPVRGAPGPSPGFLRLLLLFGGPHSRFYPL